VRIANEVDPSIPVVLDHETHRGDVATDVDPGTGLLVESAESVSRARSFEFLQP
jgi:hypothetical protein